MKQKRLIICLLICVVLMTSCSSTSWDCTLFSNSNAIAISQLAIPIAEEATYWNAGYFESATADSEKTIFFDGQTYTGSYVYSICPPGCGIIMDYYHPQDPIASGCAEFCVDSSTGALLSIDFITSAFYDKHANTSTPTQTEAALQKIAEQWASLYIDSDEYTVRLSRKDDLTDPQMTLYTFEFVKVVNGVDTTDRLLVLLSDRGELGYITPQQLGWVEENIDQLNDFSKINPSKLIETTMGLKSANVEEQWYGITPDSEVVLLVNCVVESKTGATELISMVIKKES